MRFYLNKIPKLYCVDHPLPFFFILAVLGLHCSAGFSLVEVGGATPQLRGAGAPAQWRLSQGSAGSGHVAWVPGCAVRVSLLLSMWDI